MRTGIDADHINATDANLLLASVPVGMLDEPVCAIRARPEGDHDHLPAPEPVIAQDDASANLLVCYRPVIERCLDLAGFRLVVHDIAGERREQDPGIGCSGRVGELGWQGPLFGRCVNGHGITPILRTLGDAPAQGDRRGRGCGQGMRDGGFHVGAGECHFEGILLRFKLQTSGQMSVWSGHILERISRTLRPPRDRRITPHYVV
jgi:hypothetical protein